jgi:hypothetical protein
MSPAARETAAFPSCLAPSKVAASDPVRVQSARAKSGASRRHEAIAVWERLRDRSVGAVSIPTVLADLGRPVVGFVEPEREFAAARADRQAIQSAAGSGSEMPSFHDSIASAAPLKRYGSCS